LLFAVSFPDFERDDLRRRRRLLPADPDGAGVGGIGLALAVLFPDLERGDLWFRHRQWDLAACHKKVELARKQHHEVAGMANATGDASCIIAGTPVEIGARRSDDRRSRILRDHQAAEG
jgi:hypothetical protein